MTQVMDKIRSELTKLNDAERGELAHFLLLSLDSDTDDGTDDGTDAAWNAELDRHMEEIQSGQDCGEPFRVFKSVDSVESAPIPKIKEMRGFLKGIHTSIRREADRL